MHISTMKKAVLMQNTPDMITRYPICVLFTSLWPWMQSQIKVLNNMLVMKYKQKEKEIKMMMIIS